MSLTNNDDTVIEVLLTAAFVFSVFMLAADKNKGTVSDFHRAVLAILTMFS